MVTMPADCVRTWRKRHGKWLTGRMGRSSGLAQHRGDTLADLGGHGAPAPAVALGMRPGERVAHPRLPRLWKKEPRCARSVAPVAHAVGSVPVVAARDVANL